METPDSRADRLIRELADSAIGTQSVEARERFKDRVWQLIHEEIHKEAELKELEESYGE